MIPGVRVSVNTVLSALERQPDEYVLDPWGTERATIVVEQRERVVAAAHLQRFSGDARVSDDYRDAGLIQFSLAFPEVDEPLAIDVLLRACRAQLRAWSVAAAFADGQLPFPGAAGVPAAWPHVRAALARAGFAHVGSTEVVLMATSTALVGARAGSEGVAVRRELGGVHAVLVAVDDPRDRTRWPGFQEVTENARGWRFERAEAARAHRRPRVVRRYPLLRPAFARAPVAASGSAHTAEGAFPAARGARAASGDLARGRPEPARPPVLPEGFVRDGPSRGERVAWEGGGEQGGCRD